MCAKNIVSCTCYVLKVVMVTSIFGYLNDIVQWYDATGQWTGRRECRPFERRRKLFSFA
jgi:hypothetical protein